MHSGVAFAAGFPSGSSAREKTTAVFFLTSGLPARKERSFQAKRAVVLSGTSGREKPTGRSGCILLN